MAVYDDRQESLAIPIDRLEKDIQDFKSNQVFGSRSLKIYHIQTSNTWDVVNASLPTSNTESKWRVTFTPDNKDFYVEFELNWQFTAFPTTYDAVYSWDDGIDITSPYSRSFIVWTQNDYMNTQQLSLKFAFKTTSTGTISWTRLL